MTRAQQQTSFLGLISTAYFLCFFELLPIFPAKFQKEILPVLPFWALVAFGAYLLSSVGWNLLFFNNAPEAQNTLVREIEVARKELRGMGVDVD